MRLELSATIDRPVDRLSEYVWTPENDPRWVAASFRHENEPPIAFALRSISGPIPATIRVLLESLDGGARTKARSRNFMPRSQMSWSLITHTASTIVGSLWV